MKFYKKQYMKKYRQTHRKQMNQWRREYYQTIKKIMRGLKINGCAICGYDKCDDALDFHHTNPKDKKFPLIMCNIYRSSFSVTEEINKCILLCKNCHAEVEHANKK